MKKLFSIILTFCLFAANCLTVFALSAGLDAGGINFPNNKKVGSIFGEGSVLMLIVLTAIVVLAVIVAVAVRRKKNSTKTKEPKDKETDE